MTRKQWMLVLLPTDAALNAFIGIWYVNNLQKGTLDSTQVTLMIVGAIGALFYIGLSVAIDFSTAQLSKKQLVVVLCVISLVSYIVLYSLSVLVVGQHKDDTIMIVMGIKRAFTDVFYHSFRDRMKTTNLPEQAERNSYDYLANLIVSIFSMIGALIYIVFTMYVQTTPENKYTIYLCVFVLFDLDFMVTLWLLWTKKLDLE